MDGRRRKKKEMGYQAAKRYEWKRRLGEKDGERGKKGNGRRMKLVKKKEEVLGINKKGEESW